MNLEGNYNAYDDNLLIVWFKLKYKIIDGESILYT